MATGLTLNERFTIGKVRVFASQLLIVTRLDKSPMVLVKVRELVIHINRSLHIFCEVKCDITGASIACIRIVHFYLDQTI